MPVVAVLDVSVRAGVQKFIKPIQRARKALKNFTKDIPFANTSLLKFGTILSTAFAAGLTAAVQKQRVFIDQIAKTGQELDASTKDLIALNLAAKFSGSSINELKIAFQKMRRRIGEASEGYGEAFKVMDKLNVPIEKLIEMDAASQFVEIAKSMGKITNETKQGAFAFAFMGRQGLRQINTMRAVEDGLDPLIKKTEKLGTSFDEFAAKKVEIMNDAFVEAEDAVRGLATQLTIELAPALTVAARAFEKIVTSGGGANEKIKAFLTTVENKSGALLDLLNLLKGIFDSIQLLTAVALRGLAGVFAKVFRDAEKFADIFKLKEFGFLVETQKKLDFLATLFEEFGKNLEAEAGQQGIEAGQNFSKFWNETASIDAKKFVRDANKKISEEARRQVEAQQKKTVAAPGLQSFREGRRFRAEARKREIESLIRGTQSTDPIIAREALDELRKLSSNSDKMLIKADAQLQQERARRSFKKEVVPQVNIMNGF